MRSAKELARATGRVAMVATCAATGGAFGIAFWVDAFGRRERVRRADAIVVLGARVWPTGPSPALRARVERAAELFRGGFAPRLILAGGVGPHPPAESAVARKLALGMGVPPGACVEESQSLTTEENARYVAALMRARGWRTAIVVSDGYHLLRARQLFRREGMEVMTCPARYGGRQFGLWDRLAWTSREALALLVRPEVLLASTPEPGHR